MYLMCNKDIYIYIYISLLHIYLYYLLFCSETVFNLSRKVLTETEIKILEKGLDFASIQRKINEPELRSDFEEFCRRVRVKWHFRNEPSPDFSNIP